MVGPKDSLKKPVPCGLAFFGFDKVRTHPPLPAIWLGLLSFLHTVRRNVKRDNPMPLRCVGGNLGRITGVYSLFTVNGILHIHKAGHAKGAPHGTIDFFEVGESGHLVCKPCLP